MGSLMVVILCWMEVYEEREDHKAKGVNIKSLFLSLLNEIRWDRQNIYSILDPRILGSLAL